MQVTCLASTRCCASGSMDIRTRMLPLPRLPQSQSLACSLALVRSEGGCPRWSEARDAERGELYVGSLLRTGSEEVMTGSRRGPGQETRRSRWWFRHHTGAGVMMCSRECASCGGDGRTPTFTSSPHSSLSHTVRMVVHTVQPKTVHDDRSCQNL